MYRSLPFSGNTLFVGNLAWEVDEDTLGEFFSSQGHTPSSVRIITNQEGRSRGYVELKVKRIYGRVWFPHTHVSKGTRTSISCTSNNRKLGGALGIWLGRVTHLNSRLILYSQVWLCGVYNTQADEEG